MSIAIVLGIVSSTVSLVGWGGHSILPAANGSQRVGGCNPVLTCSPKTEPKVAKKFKRKSSIPIQISLSKNDNIQIIQYIEMSQDLNRSTCSSVVIFMYWAMGMRKSHFQCEANREVTTTSPRFCNEPHLLHVLLVKVVPGTNFTSWSKHHFLWLERPSNKCAKLHTVVLSNNKGPTLCSSYFCLFAPHGCCSSCTSRSWWITHSPQSELRGYNICSKVGLDFVKQLRVKETSKMQTEKT